MGRGALVFKGDKPKKKKRKSKSDGPTITTPASVHISNRNSKNILPPVIQPKKTKNLASSEEQHLQHNPKTDAASPSPDLPQLKPGTGQITSSGTVVTGHNTRFEREFQPGDAMVVVTIPPASASASASNDTEQQPQQEMRVVKMRLSNTSCGISSAFSTNLSRPTDFFILAKPRPEKKAKSTNSSSKETSLSETASFSAGTIFQGKETYRERTEHGSYRLKSMDGESNRNTASRSELLAIRAKKTSDKYC